MTRDSAGSPKGRDTVGGSTATEGSGNKATAAQLPDRPDDAMLTPVSQRLAEIRERAEKATPGPWRSMREGNQYVDTRYLPTARCVGASRVDGIERPWNPHAAISLGGPSDQHEVARFLDADADFVAHARADIPYLLDERDRLLTQLAERERMLADLSAIVADEVREYGTARIYLGGSAFGEGTREEQTLRAALARHRERQNG